MFIDTDATKKIGTVQNPEYCFVRTVQRNLGGTGL